MPRQHCAPPTAAPSRYIYFLDVSINFGGDADGDHPFHFAGGEGMLLRGVTVRGSNSDGAPFRTRVRRPGAGWCCAGRCSARMPYSYALPQPSCMRCLARALWQVMLCCNCDLLSALRLRLQEAVKLNQVQGAYIESCDIALATDNAIDAVSVQVGG